MLVFQHIFRYGNEQTLPGLLKDLLLMCQELVSLAKANKLTEKSEQKVRLLLGRGPGMGKRGTLRAGIDHAHTRTHICTEWRLQALASAVKELTKAKLKIEKVKAACEKVRDTSKALHRRLKAMPH